MALCCGAEVLPLSDDEQWLAKFDRLAVFYEYGFDHPSLIRIDLIEQLHRLDDAQGIARIYALAYIDKRFGAWGG
jgi:hypothetical protein